jgi:amidophosphoribosyltransferase
MSDFVAFRAMIELLKDSGKDYMLGELHEKCKASTEHRVNFVQQLYNQFSNDEVSNKIAEIVRPEDMKAELEVVFQTVDNLHKACPKHKGDWYFTGNYPTAGGIKVVNRSFTNYMEGKLVRAY